MAASILSVSVTGLTGAGPMAAAGLLVGDMVIAVKGGIDQCSPCSYFEQFVSAAGALQQLATDDLSAYTFNVLVARW